MAPFYGWSSTASRLQPLWGGSLLFTSQFPEILGILSLTYNKMPPPLLFWSSLWGTEKPFIKDWIDGKVLSKLVSDNIKIWTYCTSEINSISNLLWMEFIFKWPIIEKPCLPISERQDALGMRLYIWQYIWIFYLSS